VYSTITTVTKSLFLVLLPKLRASHYANFSNTRTIMESNSEPNQTLIPCVNILSLNTSRGELRDQADCPSAKRRVKPDQVHVSALCHYPIGAPLCDVPSGLCLALAHPKTPSHQRSSSGNPLSQQIPAPAKEGTCSKLFPMPKRSSMMGWGWLDTCPKSI
jgi:hypothetical protein